MAQKIQTIYIDDLTGNESEEVNTHVFSLDGVAYEIDLVPENYDKLYEALGPFIDKGRKQGRVKGAPKARKAPDGGPSAEEVRAWARGQGIEVNDRGRVPSTVREQYEAAH
ncbi:Lsr2 family protein [Streptomyces sp. NBC_00687]|uniref:histone-like nucleoid-structuring protein Lsr2 n=1 Tax=Streptomyces sp. NBC_00687 TaxID=2975807 RepID=UPI002251CBC2|nr:Lsr2 family protein [Streptomyces sp. NBC_00687]MCX4912804.1 Lsr2 family protein [Streptomyces sp. NBC_00687]